MMKILIISHNPITTFDAMGKTMLTLFSGFEKQELCQFFIYPTIPDVDKCNSYYRITDKEILRSYFKFKVGGREISETDIAKAESTLFESDKDENLYRNRKNKKAFRMLLRDSMWKYSRWFNKGLKDWIEKEKPTHIFLAPGNARFIYRIALKISKKYNLPIVSYICDDYYFVKKPNGILARIQQNALKKILAKTLRKSSSIITICDNLATTYGNEFNVQAKTVMTGSAFPIAEKPREIDKVTELTYMGNIRCNRYITLSEIGRSLDVLNEEQGSNYLLKIYTAEKDGTILSNFTEIKSIRLCDFVSGEEFDKTLHNAQILVHVEAFDDDSIDLVKNSVSTKIADSLGSGVCLFAYGPKEVASMQYLIANNSAVCCTEQSQLKQTLSKLFEDGNLRKTITENALRTARENHSCDKVGESVRSVFDKVIDESITS